MRDDASTGPGLLTQAQAVERWGIPAATLRRWRLERAGPPYVKVGQRFVRYRVSDVERWLTVHTVGAGRSPQ